LSIFGNMMTANLQPRKGICVLNALDGIAQIFRIYHQARIKSVEPDPAQNWKLF